MEPSEGGIFRDYLLSKYCGYAIAADTCVAERLCAAKQIAAAARLPACRYTSARMTYFPAGKASFRASMVEGFPFTVISFSSRSGTKVRLPSKGTVIS